eukprot:TRINITY_DN7993_c0_g1_i9.p1 TRINITY_DN7993_c0_g1~~TRINITY_DN7993_c0_g1_i9.p1  ORF type:complete len:558 (+),score=86.67 TRINITY_DN7993_c0_g1_i9:99-1772(+)
MSHPVALLPSLSSYPSTLSPQECSIDEVTASWMMHSYPVFSHQNLHWVLLRLITSRKAKSDILGNIESLTFGLLEHVCVRENTRLQELTRDLLKFCDFGEEVKEMILERLESLSNYEFFLPISEKPASVFEVIRKCPHSEVVLLLLKKGLLQRSQLPNFLFNLDGHIMCDQLLELHERSDSVLTSLDLFAFFEAIFNVPSSTLSEEATLIKLDKLKVDSQISVEVLERMLMKSVQNHKFVILQWTLDKLEETHQKVNMVVSIDMTEDELENLYQYSFTLFTSIVSCLIFNHTSPDDLLYKVLFWVFLKRSHESPEIIEFLTKVFKISDTTYSQLCQEYFNLFPKWEEEIPKKDSWQRILPYVDINQLIDEYRTILVCVMRATKTYEHIMFFIEFGYTRFQLPHVPSLLALSCDETMWNFLAPRVYPEEDLPWGQEIWKCKNCRNTYTSLYRLEFHQTHHENLTSELCVTSNLHDTRLVIEIIMLNNYLSVMDLQNFSSTCTDLLHLESCVWPILAPQFGHGKVSVCMFCRRIYKNSENDSNLCRLPLNFFNEVLLYF